VTQSGARWGGRRWKWAGKLAMNDETSLRVFIALCVSIITIIAYVGNGPVAPRLIGAAYQAVSVTLTLIVLLRVGIFASAIMFTVDILLQRMPLTLDGNALYAPSAWTAIAAILGLAAAGLWMARSGESLIREH
jgi:hypothetical protein